MTKKSKPAAAQRIEVEPIFGDFAELEHVCELLREQAKVTDAPAGHSVHENGPVRLLHQRMRKQWDGQANEIEAERPGLFDRTYLATIYREADALLVLIEGHPAALSDNLPRLELLMHKLFILPLRDFEEVQRELHRAANAARLEGVQSEKAARSETARNSVKSRTDQVAKVAFLVWARSAVAAGLSAKNVNELQGLQGFKPEWSGQAEKTLKAWANEGGFTFKTGRPRKNK